MNVNGFFRCASVAPMIAVATARAQVAATVHLTPAQRVEDIRTMARDMPRLHKSLFHTMTRAQFDSAIATLESRVATLNDDQFVVGVARIVALVRDGHTEVTRPGLYASPGYGVRLMRFSDGVFVRTAAPAYADLVGSKVLRIGGVTIDSACALARRLVGGDPNNDNFVNVLAPRLLTVSGIVHGLGLTDDRNHVTMVLERDGRQRTVVMQTAPAAPTDRTPAGWIDARTVGTNATPLWMSRPGEPYWLEYLRPSRTVYVQMNEVDDGPDESLRAFFGRVMTLVHSDSVDRLVLDLRQNTGGDQSVLRPVIVSLIRESKLDRPGAFFTIIGSLTFSAAQIFVNQLEAYTKPVFVGEPTGENTNHYGDPVSLELPHSHLVIHLSTVWWQKNPRDDRPWTPPDVYAAPRFVDYQANRDPVFDAILAYLPVPPVEEVALTAARVGGVDSGVAAVRAYLAVPERRYFARVEQRLDAAGSQLLADHHVSDATLIFQINTRLHPTSWDAFDSLAEAYVAAGDTTAAATAYRQSMRLFPQRPHSAEMDAVLAAH